MPFYGSAQRWRQLSGGCLKTNAHHNYFFLRIGLDNSMHSSADETTRTSAPCRSSLLEAVAICTRNSEHIAESSKYVFPDWLNKELYPHHARTLHKPDSPARKLIDVCRKEFSNSEVTDCVCMAAADFHNSYRLASAIGNFYLFFLRVRHQRRITDTRQYISLSISSCNAESFSLADSTSIR